MRKGFTLIELLVVIAIISILAALVVVIINPAKRMDDARLAGAKRFAGQVDYNLQFSAAAMWNFDEGSGIVAGDTSGNNNTGTIAGATWVPNESYGQYGKYALSFDGISNQVYVNSNSTLNVGHPQITITAWIYPETPALPGGIVVKNGPYYVYLNGNLIAFGLYNGVWTWVYSANNSIVANKWQHVTATYNGREMRIYIDGKQSGTTGTAFTGDLLNINSTLGIGYDPCCARYYFKGKIYGVRVFGEAVNF